MMDVFVLESVISVGDIVIIEEVMVDVMLVFKVYWFVLFLINVFIIVLGFIGFGLVW